MLGFWLPSCHPLVVSGIVTLGIPAAVGALGFSAGGIAAGSAAAQMMSATAVASGGGVAAGSTVAVLQSIGTPAAPGEGLGGGLLPPFDPDLCSSILCSRRCGALRGSQGRSYSRRSSAGCHLSMKDSKAQPPPPSCARGGRTLCPSTDALQLLHFLFYHFQRRKRQSCMETVCENNPNP